MGFGLSTGIFYSEPLCADDSGLGVERMDLRDDRTGERVVDQRADQAPQPEVVVRADDVEEERVQDGGEDGDPFGETESRRSIRRRP